MTKKTNAPKTVAGKAAPKKMAARDSRSGNFKGSVVGKGPAMPTAPGTGGTGVKAKSGKDVQ